MDVQNRSKVLAQITKEVARPIAGHPLVLQRTFRPVFLAMGTILPVGAEIVALDEGGCRSLLQIPYNPIEES